MRQPLMLRARRLLTAVVLLAGAPAAAAAPAGKPAPAKPARAVGRAPAPGLRPPVSAAARPSRAAKSAAAAPLRQVTDEAPPPSPTDPDRERILRVQEAIGSVVHGSVLGRLRVGLRVVDAASGRTIYGRRGGVLMDPASNQKVLATSAALLRLGNDFRFRTELIGPEPDGDGVIAGDVYVRGAGDPSLRARHLRLLATALAERGVVRIDGAVVADPRRLGSDEANPVGRPPLRVAGAAVEVRVRPGERDGSRPAVWLRSSPEAFTIVNEATTTKAKGRTRIGVTVAVADGRLQVRVTGRIGLSHPGVIMRRSPPAPMLYTAVLLSGALREQGVAVRDPAAVRPPPPALGPAGQRIAAAANGLDVPAERRPKLVLLAAHESDRLPLLMRRINKDSDNEYADRLLETLGAEIYGGPASMEKGVKALRGALSDLGLPAAVYAPTNGSGLGHSNRVTADGMAALLRLLYLDPRIGPELLQSLSVGGVDGTTRNRFRGSPAAERVRAKTGTLNGKSCLSGFVGDGNDVVIFAILVEGLRARSLGAVRHAQVSIVDALMHYARGAVGEAPPADEVTPGTDIEAGEETVDSEQTEDDVAPATEGVTAPATPATPEPPRPAQKGGPGR